jgi:CheY-like chemotaxis protein
MEGGERKMATILLVEDAPDLGLFEAGLLERHGHHVIRCAGAPAPFTACTMLRRGRCPLPDTADLIVFSTALHAAKGRTYRGIDLLRAYRNHPVYGGIPMLVVAFGAPSDLSGRAPIEFVEKFSPPHSIVEAAERLIGERLRTLASATAK